MSAQRQYQHGQRKGYDRHENQSGTKHLSRAFSVTSPDILGHHGGNTGAEVDDRQKNHRINPVCRGDGGHRLFAESVHELLQKNASHGTYTGLDRRRSAEMYALTNRLRIQRFFAKSKSQERIPMAGIKNHIDGHGCLCHGGGSRGSRRPVSKSCHEKQVQHHIDSRRNEHGDKRYPTVTDAPQHGGIGVIHRQKRDTDENDTQIALCAVKDMFRRIHQM